MTWNEIWLDIFGTTTYWGVDMGFWLGMGISLLVAVLMNVVFWSMPPYRQSKRN